MATQIDKSASLAPERPHKVYAKGEVRQLFKTKEGRAQLLQDIALIEQFLLVPKAVFEPAREIAQVRAIGYVNEQGYYTCGCALSAIHALTIPAGVDMIMAAESQSGDYHTYSARSSGFSLDEAHLIEAGFEGWKFSEYHSAVRWGLEPHDFPPEEYYEFGQAIRERVHPDLLAYDEGRLRIWWDGARPELVTPEEVQRRIENHIQGYEQD